MTRRLVALAVLLLGLVAAAAPPATPLEDLVAEADLIVWARVAAVERSQSEALPDRLTLEVAETLLGNPVPRLSTGFFSEAWDIATPAAGQSYLFFLRKAELGWFGVRPDAFRPAPQKEIAAQLVKVRKTPRSFLGGEQTRLLLAGLRYLKPQAGDQDRLLTLLNYPEGEVQVRAARALAPLEPKAALEWLFANWPAADNKRFLRFHQVVSEVLGKSLYAAIDTTEDRQRAIDLYRLAWWLSTPENRDKAIKMLPSIAAEAAGEDPGWAIEALSLYAPDLALEPLTQALTKADEEWTGRILALLEPILARPNAAVRRQLEGATGDRLRQALTAVSRRKYVAASLRAFLPAEARRLLKMLD